MSRSISPVSVQPEALVEKIDALASTTYIGQAVPGTATSAAKWRIQKLDVSGTVTTIQYANGDLEFNNVWDDRTTLTYA